MATIKKTVVEKQQKKRVKTGSFVTCVHCKKLKSSNDVCKIKSDLCHKDYGFCKECGSKIIEEEELEGLKKICELLNIPLWQANYEASKAFHGDTFENYIKIFYTGVNAGKRFIDSDMFKKNEEIEQNVKKKKKKFVKIELEDLDLNECWERWGADTDENDYVALETEFMKLKGHEAVDNDDLDEIIGLAKTRVLLNEAFKERNIRDIKDIQAAINSQKKLRQERIKERGDNSMTSLGVAVKLLEHDKPINLQPGKYTDEFAIKYFKRFVVHHLKVMLGQAKRDGVELLEGEDEEIFELESKM